MDSDKLNVGSDKTLIISTHTPNIIEFTARHLSAALILELMLLELSVQARRCHESPSW